MCAKPEHSTVSLFFYRINKKFAGLNLSNQNSNTVSTQNRGQGYNPATTLTAFVTTQNTMNISNPFLASSESATNTNWYVDSGATNHVIVDYANIKDNHMNMNVMIVLR